SSGGGTKARSFSFIVPAYADFKVSSVIGSGDFTHATVTFSYPVNPATAGVPGNYTISGLTVSAAAVSADSKFVTLTTTKQTGGTTYNVTFKNITDALGRALPANSSASFGGFVLTKGGVVQKYWDNIMPNNTDALRNDPRFPDSPTFTTIEPRFEYPPN